jgi:chromosome segregation ATPase
MRKTRELNKELKLQKMTIADSTRHEQEHRTELAIVRQSATNVQVDLEATQEQISSTRANTALKEHEQAKLQEKLANAQERQKLKISPEVIKIREEIETLEQSLVERKVTITALAAENKTLQEGVARSNSQLTELQNKKTQANARLVEASSIPIKFRGKVATVESALSQLKAEEAAAQAQLRAHETAIQEVTATNESTEQGYQEAVEETFSVADQVDAGRRQIEQLGREISSRADERLRREAEQLAIEKSIRDYEIVLRDTDQQLEKLSRDIDKRKVATFRMEDAILRLQGDREGLERRDQKLKEELRQEEKRVEKLRFELDKTMKGREDALKALLAAETVSQETLNHVKAALADRDQKQLIVDALAKKKLELIQQLQEATTIRNRKGREVVVLQNKIQELKSVANQNHLTLIDLTQQLEAINVRIYDTSILYEKVKMDRNRCTAMIQSSRETVVELTEKINLLETGVDVLRREYREVEFGVRHQKSILLSAFNIREATKAELWKAEGKYKDLQWQIDYQLSETVRMNRVLEQVEDMIRMQQRRYSVQADECANAQRSLLDRQDQLCMI